MKRDELRLKLLELALTTTRDIDIAIGSAKKFETFVSEPVAEEPKPVAVEKRGPGRPRQNADNSDILS
jgi:hypothetical protein